MRRPMIYALVGGCLGIALLAAFGAIYGYQFGAGANNQHPPGFPGLVVGALTWTVFLGPVAGVVGALAGFGVGVAGTVIAARSGRIRRRGLERMRGGDVRG